MGPATSQGCGNTQGCPDVDTGDASYDRLVTRRLVVPAALAAAVLAGCGSGAINKAGGSGTPTVLRLADSDSSDQPSTEAVLHFAAEVEKISHGSLRVHVTFLAAGSDSANVEEKTIKLVHSRQYDLGVIGARAWDEVGVNSFRALQAPFLITTTALLNRVVESPVAADMLATLRSKGFVGLALVPDHLRRPVGFGRAFVSLSAFATGRIRIIPSDTTAQIIRSLGAKVLEVSNSDIGQAIADGRVNGEELSLYNSPGNTVIPANVVLFGKALSFFANGSSFAHLDATQRSMLQTAARATTRYVTKFIPSELSFGRNSCPDRRRFVLAQPSALRAMVRAVQPVYLRLERDSQTRRLIERIQMMKRQMPASPPVRIAPSCEKTVASPTASGKELPASFVNGTFRWVLTAKDARAFGAPASGPGNVYPAVTTMVLQNGTWRFVSPSNDHGTYVLRGARIRFYWENQGYYLVFRFTRDPDGTLRLHPVLPMDRGDQFVWANQPWKRIGPPAG